MFTLILFFLGLMMKLSAEKLASQSVHVVPLLVSRSPFWAFRAKVFGHDS